MALVPSLLLLLQLLHLSCSPTVLLAAADEHEYTIVAMSSLKPEATCSGYRVTPPQNITWVPLKHPHGPCSPLAHAATAPSLAELLHRDQLRAERIQMRFSNDTPGDSKKVDSPDQYQQDSIGHNVDGNVGNAGHPPSSMQQQAAAAGNIGASAAGRSGGSLPGVVQTFVVDTASDVPWVQCLPCPIPPCHPQVDSFYDPSRSASSAPFPCGSPACAALGAAYGNGCVNGQCQYRVAYPDGTFTSGTYIADLLTFDPTHAVPGFRFGCSHVERGSFDGRTAGIMALGGGPESLVSQTASRYRRVFAYCIPATNSYTGFFILGVPGQASSRYVVTPMVRFKQSVTFYGVLLRGITVGGQRLAIPAAVFAPGSVLDSRTDITRLPPTAYQALRAAFRSAMTMYRSAPPKGILDTCYDFTGVVNIRLPKITLVFDGNAAAVTLDPSGILFHDCLAFAPNAGDGMPGILGSVQQQTIEVLYNVGGGTVGFRQGAC